MVDGVFVKLFRVSFSGLCVCVYGVGARHVVSFESKSKARNVDQADSASLKHDDKVDKNEPL